MHSNYKIDDAPAHIVIHQLLVQTEINGGSSIACMFTAACLHFSLTHKTIAPFPRIFYLQKAMNSCTRFNCRRRRFVITKVSLFLVFNLLPCEHLNINFSLILKSCPFDSDFSFIYFVLMKGNRLFVNGFHSSQLTAESN